MPCKTKTKKTAAAISRCGGCALIADLKSLFQPGQPPVLEIKCGKVTQANSHDTSLQKDYQRLKDPKIHHSTLHWV